MSELVTDEIVERIARRRYEDHVRIDKYPQNWPTWEDFHGVFKDAVYAGARSEAEAIAPLIAAQTLREAARAEFQPTFGVSYSGLDAQERMIRRADRIEAGR